jgi:hypothetical protein
MSSKLKKKSECGWCGSRMFMGSITYFSMCCIDILSICVFYNFMFDIYLHNCNNTIL